MKTLLPKLFVALPLAVLTLGMAGCLSGGHGYPSDHGVYYGAERDPWFRDDSWIDDHGFPDGGHRDMDGRAYLHPPGHRW